MGHVEVGAIMQGWDGSYRGRVGHVGVVWVMYGWGGSCMGGWGG